MRLAVIVLPFALACGTVAQGSTDASADGMIGACTAPRQTRAGVCASASKECSAADAGTCGACSVGEQCAADRCYAVLGLPSDAVGDLYRGFYAAGEGTECVATVSGALERVEANLWSDGISAIVMDVYAECGGSMVKVVELQRLASQFPGWGAADGKSPPAWTIDPPLAVAAGTKLRVLFRAGGSHAVTGGGPATRSGVEEIVRADVDPNCHFVSEDWGGLSGVENWDVAVHLFVHPQ